MESTQSVGFSRLVSKPSTSENDPYPSVDTLQGLIREAVINIFGEAGDKSEPFSTFIKPGMVVLIKPNWVTHINSAGTGLECLITHPKFIIAVFREVVKSRPAKIILGDAPIQGCDWNKIVTPDFSRMIEQEAHGIPCEIIDFRTSRMVSTSLENGILTHTNQKKYCLFDLGSDSQLEPVSKPEGKFRVTMYDPRKLAERHSQGTHQYLLRKEAFEADIILNLPKLKTHRKAGITGALKNLVGLNGNKDFLPHHRVGGTTYWGGDCYPGFAPLKRLVEYYLDRANQNIGNVHYSRWLSRAQRVLDLQVKIGDTNIEGGWYGNDTLWRMVLDINRILRYGKPNSTMAENPQRVIYSLTDAILCGEKNGPLAPTPRWLGIVSFSNSPAAADFFHSALFRFNPQKIPLLAQVNQQLRWPLVDQSFNPISVNQNHEYNMEEVAFHFGVNAQPADGWVGQCELP